LKHNQVDYDKMFISGSQFKEKMFWDAL